MSGLEDDDNWFDSLSPEQQESLIRRVERGEREIDAGQSYEMRSVLGFWLAVRSPAWPNGECPQRNRIADFVRNLKYRLHGRTYQ